jgi:septum formation protein
MKLLLASASPRRAELLTQAGIPFRVEVPLINETAEKSSTPRGLVHKLARKKALEVSTRVQDRYILAADTIVTHDGKIIGKPDDEADAFRMLACLSGNKHEVFTGLVLLDVSTGKMESGVAVTSVWMKKLSALHINNYVATGEPFDKAGAYAIQGYAGLFIEKIEGCYTNVVGLPLGLLNDLFMRSGYPIWLNRKDGDNAK